MEALQLGQSRHRTCCIDVRPLHLVRVCNELPQEQRCHDGAAAPCPCYVSTKDGLQVWPALLQSVLRLR